MSFLRRRWVIGALTLVVGFMIGLFVPSPLANRLTAFSGHEEREVDHNYTFINPLLACADDDFSSLANDETEVLDTGLEQLLKTKEAGGDIFEGAVYFRDLNGGPWAGTGFNKVFTPGSLLKVPLAMSVYSMAEDDPAILNRSIEYEGGTAPGEQHFTAPVITPGVYVVDDLVNAMLENSDNNAATLLAQIVGKEHLNESYAHLGITVPEMGTDYSTTVRTYASFFRILYNATYLDRKNSEHLLSLLANSKFTAGLVAGVPPGIVVAHKFGERAIADGGLVQLHDCGIVYKPDKPYLLCVMLRGKDFDTLAGSIKDISSFVYSHVN